MSPQQRRWQRLSSTTRALLATSPDEHECLDFKANAHPLTDEYLAMMANAAALAGETHATVLVGVTEHKDVEAGTTSGRIVGLTDDLHRTAETIAQRASMTAPTPVGIAIFEENVGSKPILRVTITPTSPPHYDQRGRRATRQHTTTRAMSDAEILQLLEAREQRRYDAVAEETANLMMGDFRVVSEEMIDKLERQESWATDSAREVRERFDELWSRIDLVETRLDDLPEQIDPSDPQSMEHIIAAVAHAREAGLIALAMRIDDLTDEDVLAIDRLVSSPLDALRYTQNRRELQAWHDLQAIAFDEGSDLSAAVRKVVAAHAMGDAAVARSVRDYAARINKERKVGHQRPTPPPRRTRKR